jgi:hypothetical protein
VTNDITRDRIGRQCYNKNMDVTVIDLQKRRKLSEDKLKNTNHANN